MASHRCQQISDPRLSEEDRAFLKTYKMGDFPRPSVTTDIVAVTIRNESTGDWRKPVLRSAAVLLIRRGVSPFKGMWALPGGFLRPDETVEECARRELREETGLETRALLPIGSFSKPGRDPRGWIISNAFLSLVGSDSNEIPTQAGDDADKAVWCKFRFVPSPNGGEYTIFLPSGEGLPPFEVTVKSAFDTSRGGAHDAKDNRGQLAFDHADILVAAFQRLRTDFYARNLAFAFLKDSFTLAELHDVLRLYGIADDNPSNFRRKVRPFVEPTGIFSFGDGHRPAALYRRREL